MMKLLQDKTKHLACLVDCKLDGDRILCGAAVFKGGLSGCIEVSDGVSVFKIKIPDSVANLANYEVLFNPSTNLVSIELWSESLLEKAKADHPKSLQ
jgi:hypothetical protein